MKKYFIASVFLLCNLPLVSAYAETINTTGTFEETHNEFHTDNYKPCKQEEYPIKNMLNTPVPSDVPGIGGGCIDVNGQVKCDFNGYYFQLRNKTSFEYYESDGTKCVKKTANQSTPGFKIMSVYQFPIPLNLCDNNACLDISSQQGGRLVSHGTEGNQASMEVTYDKRVTQDVIILKSDFGPSGSIIAVKYK